MAALGRECEFADVGSCHPAARTATVSNTPHCRRRTQPTPMSAPVDDLPTVTRRSMSAVPWKLAPKPIRGNGRNGSASANRTQR